MNTADLEWISPFLILVIAGMLLVLAEAFFKGKDHTALVGLAQVETDTSLAAVGRFEEGI